MLDKTVPAEPKPIIMYTSIFEYLRKYTRTQHPLLRYVVLAFDLEMSNKLRKNIKPAGDDKTFPQRCILFNLRFLNQNKHLFIGSVYYFENASMVKVSHTIKAFIDDLFSCDLKVIATVSSGKMDLLQVIKELNPVKSFDGFIKYRVGKCGEIIHIFDPSWLLRQVHHIFQFNNILYDINDEVKTASYSDCVQLFKSSAISSSFYQSISKVHITTSAAKTLSYTVASLLQDLITSSDRKKKIQTPYNGTVDFCHFFDQLFDTCNTSPGELKKNYRKPCTNFSYHMTYWNNAATILQTMHPEFEYVTVEPKNKVGQHLTLQMQIDELLSVFKNTAISKDTSDDMDVCDDLKETEIAVTEIPECVEQTKPFPQPSTSTDIEADTYIKAPGTTAVNNAKTTVTSNTEKELNLEIEIDINDETIDNIVNKAQAICNNENNTPNITWSSEMKTGKEKCDNANNESGIVDNLKQDRVDELLNFAILHNLNTNCKLSVSKSSSNADEIEAEVHYVIKHNPDENKLKPEPEHTSKPVVSDSLICFIEGITSISVCLNKFVDFDNREIDRLKILVALIRQDAIKIQNGEEPGRYMENVANDNQLIEIIQCSFVPIMEILNACVEDMAFAGETAIEIYNLLKTGLKVNNSTPKPKPNTKKEKIPYILKNKNDDSLPVYPQMELFEKWRITVCGLAAIFKRANELRINELYTKYINCDIIYDQIYRLQTEFKNNAELVVAPPDSEVLDADISALALSSLGNFTVRK